MKKINGFNYQVDDSFEIHTLCQEKDVPLLVWSLASFLHYSKLYPKIIVHDDGTLTKRSAEFLQSKFSNLEVIFRGEADRLIKDMPGLSGKLLEYRGKGHNLILKLVDICLLSKGSKIMVLDTDVLFFNEPQEIRGFMLNDQYDSLISAHDGSYDLGIDKNYLNKHDLFNKRAAYMNSGIILFKKDKLTQDMLLGYFDSCLRDFGDYFVEMAGWGCIIAQTNYSLLPINKYIIKSKPTDNTIAKHFTSPRRHEFYIYGIDKIRKVIKYGSNKE